MAKLNKTPLTIRAKRGTESQITSYTGYQLSGEFAYATDTNNLYVSNGTTFLAVGGGSTAESLDLDTVTQSDTTIDFTMDGDAFFYRQSYGDNGTTTPFGRNIFIGKNTGNVNVGSTANANFKGSDNIGIGDNNLDQLTDGARNISIGQGVGGNITTGGSNVMLGWGNGGNITTGSENFLLGNFSGGAISTHKGNVAIGTTALQNGRGFYNIAIGDRALQSDSNASVGNNVAIGRSSMTSISTGSDANVGIGSETLANLGSNADGNIAIGYQAGMSGVGNGASYNILIGYRVEPPVSTGDGQLNIGNLIYGTGLTADQTLSTGSVGIGTAAPSAKLDVRQSEDDLGLKIVGFDDENNSNLHLFVDRFGNNKIISSEFLELNSGASSRYRTAGYLRLEVGGVSNQLQLDYNYIKLTSGGTETMRITPGNVGIGTTSPAYPLHVAGDTYISTGLSVGTSLVYANSVNINNSGQYRIGNAEFISKSANDMNIYQGRMFVTNAGNVGIGTTAPAAKLHVAGEVRINAGQPLMLDVANNIYAVAAQNQFRLYSGGNPAFNITTSGNVGIGTTAPSSKVHINAAAMEQLRMETQGGPANAADAKGSIGDMAYDADFFYIKTSNGWGRVPLDFGF